MGSKPARVKGFLDLVHYYAVRCNVVVCVVSEKTAKSIFSQTERIIFGHFQPNFLVTLLGTALQISSAAAKALTLIRGRVTGFV
jgi:hypothetical protein